MKKYKALTNLHKGLTKDDVVKESSEGYVLDQEYMVGKVITWPKKFIEDFPEWFELVEEKESDADKIVIDAFNKIGDAFVKLGQRIQKAAANHQT